MTSRIEKKLCIVLMLIFISTFLSKQIVVKASGDYDYHGSDCAKGHRYCEFINNIVIPAGYKYRIDKDSKFYKANMDIYYSDKDEHKAFKIVYGNHNDIGNNEKDDNKEWRYLGFDINGNEVSNEDFTNDRET